jgi:hypothetical protein
MASLWGEAMNKTVCLWAITALSCLFSSASYADLLWLPPNQIEITDSPGRSDYTIWKKQGTVAPLPIGEEIDYSDPSYPTRQRCAYPIRGAGSGSGDNGRRVVVLARVDWCPTIKGWIATGVGDCSGSDGGSSSGLTPDPTRCTAATRDRFAVCWDGKREKNTYGEKHGAPAYPWCTYKTVTSCAGGSNPGRIFRCSP